MSAWANGSTRRWRKTRAYVLARDAELGYRCRAHKDGWCARKPGQHTCTDNPTEAHHTLGKAVTGDDPRYLVASCRACNLHIGDPTKTNDPAPRPVTQW